MLRFSLVLTEALEHFYSFWDKEVRTFWKCCRMCEGLRKPQNLWEHAREKGAGSVE